MPEQIKTPVPDIINEMSRTDVFLIRGATLIHRPSVCEGRCALRDTLIPLTLTCVCTSQLFRHSARAAPSAGHFLPQLTVRLSAMPGSLWGLTQAFLRIIGFLPLIISQPPPFVKRMTEKECRHCLLHTKKSSHEAMIFVIGKCVPSSAGSSSPPERRGFLQQRGAEINGVLLFCTALAGESPACICIIARPLTDLQCRIVILTVDS